MTKSDLSMSSTLIMDLTYRVALQRNSQRIQIGVSRKRTLVGLTRKVQLQEALIRELTNTISTLRAENDKRQTPAIILLRPQSEQDNAGAAGLANEIS